MTYLDVRNAKALAPLEPLKKEGLKDSQIVRMQSAAKFEVLGTRAAKKFHKLSDTPVTNNAGHTHLSPKAEVITNTINYISNTLRSSARESLAMGALELNPEDAQLDEVGSKKISLGDSVMAAAGAVLQAGVVPEQKSGLPPVTVGGVKAAIEATNAEVSKAYASIYNYIHPSPREAPDGSQVGASDTTTRQDATVQLSGGFKGAKMRQRRRRSSQSLDNIKWKRTSGTAGRRKSRGARHREHGKQHLLIDEKAEVVLKAGRNPATVTEQTPVMERASWSQTPIKDVASKPVEPRGDHNTQIESPGTLKRKRDDADIGKMDDE